MKITCGFGGYIIPEHWIPVRVQVNTTVESGRIEIIRAGEAKNHHTLESYALQSTQQIEIPVFAGEGLRNVKIKLYSGEQLLTEEIVDLKARIFPGHLVLAVSVPSVVQHAIEKSLLPVEPVLVVPLQISELPGLGLNYDGVSGLLLNGPEVPLTPAQITALRSWLAGGGRMTIFDPDRDLDALFSNLQIGSNQEREYSTSRFGLGSVTVVQRDAAAMGAGNLQFWKGLFTPKPYRETVKLSSKICFAAAPLDPVKEEVPPFPTSLIIISLGVWAGAAFLMKFFRPSKAMVYLLGTILVETILVFPMAGAITARWQRGADLRTRAVIFPGNRGVLLETNIRMKFVAGMNIVDESASPWGVNISLNNIEQGGIHLNREELSKWHHKNSRPLYAVRSGNTAALNLTGWFPDVSLNMRFTKSQWMPSGSVTTSIRGPSALLIHATDRTIAWNGNRWFLFQKDNDGNPRWAPVEKPPRWLKTGQDWLVQLQASNPDVIWIGGYGSLPLEMQLRIQRVGIQEVLWAMPLSHEEFAL